MSYECPIEMVTDTVSHSLTEQTDELVMKQVVKVGVTVDKDELIKALAYDREQYEKGYRDGIMASRWIPTSERLPENNDPVNITWVNRDPEPYYKRIKDVPFTATGHYHGGKWWWYSSTCQDYLDEYGESNCDAMSEKIEVTAWMPLPEPYREDGAAE